MQHQNPRPPSSKRAFSFSEPKRRESLPTIRFSCSRSSWAWNASYAAFNGDTIREIAAQVLALAQKQALAVSLMIAYSLMGMSTLHTGSIVEGRVIWIARSGFTMPPHIAR